MLHTQFWGNPLAGSGKEDFRRGFTIYRYGGHLSLGMAAILVM